jgi:hypothetical protein
MKFFKYFIVLILFVGIFIFCIKIKHTVNSKSFVQFGAHNYNFLHIDKDLWIKDSDWSLFALKDENIITLDKPFSLHEVDLYDPMILEWKNSETCENVVILAEICSINSGPVYGCVIDRLEYKLPEGKLISQKNVLDLKPKTSYPLPITLFGKKYIVVEATLVNNGFPLFYPVDEFHDIGTRFTLNHIDPEIIINEILFDIGVLNFNHGVVLTGTDTSNKMRAFQLLAEKETFIAKEIPFSSKSIGDNTVRRNAGLLAKSFEKFESNFSGEVIFRPTMLNYKNGVFIYGHKLGIAAFSFNGVRLEADLIKDDFLEATMSSFGANGYHHIHQTNDCSDWMIGDLNFDRYSRIHGDQFGAFE